MRRDYLACVTSATISSRRFEVYPLSLRRRLPPVPIPLQEGDARIPLDLQALLDLAYGAGRYGQRIDYAAPLDPPLDPEDATWGKPLVEEAPGH